jgi:hypothetical protein
MAKNTNETNVATPVNTDEVAAIVANALDGDFSGYTAANVSTKANVRKALNAALHASVDKMDMEGATRAKAAIEGCTGAKAAKVATPVNHAEVVAKRAFQLISAGKLLLSGEAVPNGLNPADVDKVAVNAAFDALGDNADNYLDKVISDIATQKVTKSSERVDIGAHIASVIEGAEAGTFFSVRTIASTSTEAAPNGCPSDGAVAMRLFPQNGQCTLLGTLPIKPVTTPVKGLIVTE